MAGPEARLKWRERWERVTRVPLIVVGAIFIVSYSVHVLLPDLAPSVRLGLLLDFVFIWLVFVGDYLVRLIVTPRGHRWQFVRSNVVDLLSVLLPMFRAFRVINLLRDIPYFRAHSASAVRLEVVTYAASYAVFFVYFLALATYEAERYAPGASITSFGDAIWWACVTIATVGYGDTYPVTVLGRIYAVLLMAGGIAIVGTTSAVVISYIGDRVRSWHRAEPEE